MGLIETAKKEKLPKGFSYPLGAEAISAALAGIPQFGNALLWFRWRDEFWVSRWRKRLQAPRPITPAHHRSSDYFGRWDANFTRVLPIYTVLPGDILHAELPSVHSRLESAGVGARSCHISVTLSLREAEKAANPRAQRGDLKKQK